MKYLHVTNWKKWQTFRKDRGLPNWIKLYRDLLQNPEWAALNDAQRGQLVTIWLLAGSHDGDIPSSPLVLKKLGHMDTEPDIALFQTLGFIEVTEDGNQVVTERLPDGDHLPAQKRREENRKEENRGEELFEDEKTPTPQPIASLLLKSWNDMAKEAQLPTCRTMTKARNASLSERLKDADWRLSWEKAISTIPSSAFLCGNNKRRWKASIDWFLKPDSVTKILEGKYADGSVQKGVYTPENNDDIPY